MKFETKPLTLSQRIEVNNVSTQVDKETGNLIISDMFKVQIKYLKYGLKSVNDIEVNETNFEEVISDLNNNDIALISDQIADETNFPKKKKSK